jgi:hypothetical protein
MKEEIKDLVNYVIEAMKNYRQDQSAETYRLSRINQETNPASDAPATTAKKFSKINADYKEEKRLERTPKGPQTRKKPVEEGAQVPAGAVTGPARKSTDLKAKQTKDPSGAIKPLGDRKVGDPFSKADWKSRKAAMDKAIDG